MTFLLLIKKIQKDSKVYHGALTENEAKHKWRTVSRK